MGAEASTQQHGHLGASPDQQRILSDLAGRVSIDSESDPNPRHHLRLQHSASLDFVTGGKHPSEFGPSTAEGWPRNKTTNYPFSDFTCYPDRFHPNRRTSEGSMGLPMIQISQASDSGHGASQNVNISRYNFRLRSHSTASEPEGATLSQVGSPVSPQDIYDARQIQKHALPSFDFTLLPDKDAKLTPPNHSVQEQKRHRLRLSSQGEDDEYHHPDVSKTPEFQAQLAQKVPRKRMSSAPTKYSFFDYSMIPDKMDHQSQKAVRIPK
eukprot:maker-scaffold301_size216225-snap-gene-1.23 protein:Tk06229 transcript:maker-scaffold301_size216225-snap-gene-1.23-mRNA-1 annotation:"hypothetical protein"